MRRYWFEGQHRAQGQNMALSGDLHHHIRKVVRHRIGEFIEVMTEDGYSLVCEILIFTNQMTEVKVVACQKLSELPTPAIDVYLCMPKIPTFEWSLEKLSEVGVRSITPVFNAFSSIREEARYPNHKMDRFNKILQSAAEQCRRFPILELRAPVQLEKLLSLPTDGLKIFAFEKAPLHQSLAKAFEGVSLDSVGSIELLCGSEGGFSDEEAEEIQKSGYLGVSLGQLILRSETAALYLASVAAYEVQRRVATLMDPH